MGDISEMRGLITTFSIIAITVSLILAMPAQFFVTSVDTPSGPSTDLASVIGWNDTTSVNLTTSLDYDFELNGYNFNCHIALHVLDGHYHIFLYTFAKWWFIEWDADFFAWYDNESILVSEEAFGEKFIEAPTVDLYDTPATFTLKNGKTQVTGSLAYNETLYGAGNFTGALAANDAYLTFNVQWDDRNTSMNALQLVGMVLTGSLPGIDSNLSLVFSFVSWGILAAATYMLYIFILRIVGAVFGGGGA